jgi:hypothetical protein
LRGEILHWLIPSVCGWVSDSTCLGFVLVFVGPPKSNVVGSVMVKVDEFPLVFEGLDFCFGFGVVESLFRLIPDRLFLVDSSFSFPCAGAGG